MRYHESIYSMVSNPHITAMYSNLQIYCKTIGCNEELKQENRLKP